MHSHKRRLLCLLSLVLCVGCGAAPIPTKGIVSLDGKPLANASIMLIPETEGGQPATGYSDAQGRFKLTTARLKDGALRGAYKVTVRHSAPVPVPAGLKSAEDVQQAMVQAGALKQGLVLPESYTRADQTVLKHRVPDDGDLVLELRTAAPEPKRD